MIIYSETKKNFTELCNADATGIIIEKKVSEAMRMAGVGYFDEAQKRAWRNSLPAVAKVLEKSHCSDECIIAVEYNIKQSKERLDLVITGKDSNRKRNIIIVELKQWSSVNNSELDNYIRANVAHGLIQEHLHPSYQAYNYAKVIANTYKVFQDSDIGIYACSYLHNMPKQYANLLTKTTDFPQLVDSPCFLKDDTDEFVRFIDKYIVYADIDLLADIDKSDVVSSKQLSDMLLYSLHGNPFYSYDELQGISVAAIKKTVADCLYYNEKRTIIIKGGPGTGKSVVALNALGELTRPVKGKKTGYNAVYCTVNAAPRTLYSQELIQGDFNRSQLKNFFKYPNIFKNIGENAIDCTFFDEAHRMFDFKGGIGVKKGTQLLKEAIKGSRVSVFFIDEDQMVTRDDYATVERIKDYSEKQKSRVIESIDDMKLQLTTQFRVLGGEKYMSFIKSFLGYDDRHLHYSPDIDYEFRVFDFAEDMHEAIRIKDKEERNRKAKEYNKSFENVSGTCRVVAGYCYDWDPPKNDEPGKIKRGSKGQFRDGDRFDIVLDEEKYKAKWNLRCPQLPSDYSWLNDPLSVDEVGCIHTCQGLDMKYCGVIIGKDITYQDDHLVFNKNKNARSDKSSGIRKASDEIAEKLIRNTYHVLLTRGMCGTFVYCEDEGLREYLKSLLD